MPPPRSPLLPTGSRNGSRSRNRWQSPSPQPPSRSSYNRRPSPSPHRRRDQERNLDEPTRSHTSHRRSPSPYRRRDQDQDSADSSRRSSSKRHRRHSDAGDDSERRHRRRRRDEEGSKRHRNSPSPQRDRSRSPSRRSKGPRDLLKGGRDGGQSSRHGSGPPRQGSGSRQGSARPDGDAPPAEKQRPNFEPTGLLAAETNTVNGTVLKYSEPAEARLPSRSVVYKLFVFKSGEIVDTVELNPRSCWLVGRDRAVADLPVDHPSCSKQHAVLQFRYIVKTSEFGDKDGAVRLYLIDLESANGTILNGVEIEGRRFIEMREGDLVKFGLSTREYVLMLDRQA